LLAQDRIDDPAAADVRSWTAAVVEDSGSGAAGVFQGVGQDRQAVERASLVEFLGKLRDQALIPPEPMRLHRNFGERVEDVPEQKITLEKFLCRQTLFGETFLVIPLPPAASVAWFGSVSSGPVRRSSDMGRPRR
jgi:hypothetical protein